MAVLPRMASEVSSNSSIRPMENLLHLIPDFVDRVTEVNEITTQRTYKLRRPNHDSGETPAPTNP